MPTPKQIAANRLNAQKATGPRTPQGKAASRFNALKHGIYAENQIMFDETAEDLVHLDAEFREQFNPANAAERFLVDTLIHNEWRLRRMRRVEAVLWEHAADSFLSQHPEMEACNSAHAFATSADKFARLERIVDSCERNYHRALKELRQAQTKRLADTPAPCSEPVPAPQPQNSKTTSANLASFRDSSKTPAPDATPASTNPAETWPPASDLVPNPPAVA